MNLLSQKIIIPYSHSLSSSLDCEFGQETRSRTASASSSFSNMSSLDFPLQCNPQNSLADINFLLSFLSQSQPALSPSSCQFSQLKPSPQLQIPKPIRNTQFSRQINNNNQQNNMLLEASLNLFSSLILNESTKKASNPCENLSSSSNEALDSLLSKNSILKSPQQTLLNINQPSYQGSLLRNSQTSIQLNNHTEEHFQTHQSPQPGCINIHNNGSNFQTQIPYQPNIIFGVDMTLEEAQLRRDHRRSKIEKYLFKKETRRWDVLRYEVRKKIAKTRQRVKGRFVKEEKTPVEVQEGKSPLSSGFVFI